jgi:hypothetical protein
MTDKSEQIARQLFNLLKITWQAEFQIPLIGGRPQWSIRDT